jgi:hypothetical protein
MKQKIILFLSLFVVYSSLDSYAQCTVKNILIKVNSTTASGYSCVLNFDFTFTIENNGGNKYIYIHSWLQSQYPNNFGCPNMSGNLKAPLAADLLMSKINLGIHNDIHAGHPAPTLLATYVPDPAVPLTPATELIRQVYPTGDSARFTIKGVQIALPMACSQAAFMTADFWSTQSQNGDAVHCVSCNNQFVIDPQVFGSVNCMTPRTYNLIIRSVSPTPINGHFKIYTDNPLEGNIIGTFGPEDTLVDEHDYQTVLGAFNQYLGTNMEYEPFSFTKPTADRNLWALVQTDGYSNSVLGYLINSCAPLSTGLVSFDVNYSGNHVQLNWEAMPEAGHMMFDVERRVDLQSYMTIATVPAGKGSVDGKGQTYCYVDMNTTNARKIYYRLKMYMEGGQIKYSDVKLIQLDDGADVVIYPNPNNGQFFMSVPVSLGPVDVTLMDMSGKIIRQWSGITQQSVSVGRPNQGIYLLRITAKNTGKQIVKRIVIEY